MGDMTPEEVRQAKLMPYAIFNPAGGAIYNPSDCSLGALGGATAGLGSLQAGAGSVLMKPDALTRKEWMNRQCAADAETGYSVNRSAYLDELNLKMERVTRRREELGIPPSKLMTFREELQMETNIWLKDAI